MKRSALILFLLSVVGFTAYAQPVAREERPFLMAVEDVFPITGRGTVITGKVERGVVRTGDVIEIVTASGPIVTTAVEVTMFRKMVNEARQGENVGILLRAVEKTAVARGDVAAKPGTLKTFTKFTAKFDIKPTAEGGRSRPIVSGFRPLVDVWTSSLSGTVTLPQGRAETAPGETGVEMTVELTRPAPLEKGQTITLREYGKVVATGIVTSVITQK